MTEIFIDSAKSNISIKVTSQSLHAVGFEITVTAPDGNTVTERFTGDTRTKNPFSKDLANPSSTYKNSSIGGTFTVISPDGTDFPYSVLFAIEQEGQTIMPTISLTGTTNNGSDSRMPTFQVN